MVREVGRQVGREGEGERERKRDLAVLHITRYRGSIGRAGEESIVKHKKAGDY